METTQIKSIQLAIKLLIIVIFLGYIIIWIVMPTNIFWLHWLPNINAKVNSTYLGEQGTNILMHSFPVLLIATLGCLYLHLEKYSDESANRTQKDSNLASWTQPIIVKGPLGIVSWSELSVLLMFIALLIWSFSSYIHGMFKNITRQSSSKIGQCTWEVRLDNVALLLGLVGNTCLSFLFFPVARASPILQLVGLTSESSIKYHIWLGHTVLTIFVSHGLCYVVFWANTHQIFEMLRWDKFGISNVAGEIALLSGLVIWITSTSVMRRKLFELFFYTHHLYIVFIIFFVLHVEFSYSCIMLPGFFLFMIDRFLRFLQSQQRVCLVSARILPCQAMELNFSKDPRITYNPSSVVFVNVKSISNLQWHPFTVTSNNNTDPNHLSIVIRSEGSWSQKLYEMLSSSTPPQRLEVSIEGPYTPPSTSFLRHDMLVLVSGGSGITPFISIIRELIFIANNKRKAPRVLLVAAFKKTEDLTMLDLLRPLSETSQENSRLQIQTQAYVTREKNPTTNSQKLPRIIRFNPSVIDVPVSNVLGPNSWLWLGAIITSSFVLFLLIITMLNRYHIYAVDPDNTIICSYAIKSIINIFGLCSSVVIVTTLAFVWNKRRSSTDKRQIQSANAPTPLAFVWNKKRSSKDKRQIQSANTPTLVGSQMPESWFYDVERELEYVPQQSFKQVITVYYGERPNFKKILSECEGSNVGVLVSGPKKMRQDVAALCASSLVKGMHYRSFSFSW